MQRPKIEVIFSANEIAKRVSGLAEAIAQNEPDDLLIVAILKGSFIFASDLIRALHHAGLTPEVDFVTLASYKSQTVSSGKVTVLRDIESNVEGRSVLILDDILESGRTLDFAKELVQTRGATRVSTCVLLNKPGKRATEIEADYYAFDCPDEFVVGYGMDLAHRYRELPYVGKLTGSEPEK